MTETIKLKPDEWDKIYLKIKEEFADQPSIFMIRGRMREVLGFTQRTHRYWEPDSGRYWEPDSGTRSYDGGGRYVTEIHLDFYDESAQTMFRLKYL